MSGWANEQDERTAHRAAVEAGYAPLSEYIEKWGHADSAEKRKGAGDAGSSDDSTSRPRAAPKAAGE